MSDIHHDKIVWTFYGKPILHEYADGTYELAEGVSEREALDFCVKNLQTLREQQRRERRMYSTVAAFAAPSRTL